MLFLARKSQTCRHTVSRHRRSSRRFVLAAEDLRPAGQTNTKWNENDPEVSRFSHQKGSPVKFEIKFIHVDIETVKRNASTNQDGSVNFLRVVNDENGTSSFFEGNSGVLNLWQNSSRNGTTVAHEMGHMMGFRSNDLQDNTHISDNVILENGFGNDIPLMYSGGYYADKLSERIRTKTDLDGLNIWKAAFVGNENKFIGEPINNKIHE